MTVATQTFKVTANGNGVATVFSFSPMVIYGLDDLLVTINVAGVETVIARGSSSSTYSVGISIFPATGSITYPAVGGTPLAAGSTITIKRVLTLEQATNLENQGGYLPEVQESQFDKLVMIDLQQQELINRSLKAPITSALVPVLPMTATDGALLLWDGTNGLMKNGPVAGDIAAAQANAAAAATSATNAATSATNAASVFQNSQSAAYTLVIGDAGKHIFHPSADATARIWTIPANASVAFPIGTAVTFVNQNAAGVITIAITTDTLRLSPGGTTGSRTLAANGMASALKVTATEWIISGSGLS